jgi:membrane-bound lytic murein transglycosylase
MSFKKPNTAASMAPIVSDDRKKQINEDKPLLSKSVLGMKFMQKKVVEEENQEAVNSLPTSSTRASSSNSGVNWERDSMQVSFPGRRSFGGCNKFIERHYSKTLEDQYNIKLSDKESKATISDEEMLKRYEDLVSLPRGPNQGAKKQRDNGKPSENRWNEKQKKSRRLEEDSVPMQTITSTSTLEPNGKRAKC